MREKCLLCGSDKYEVIHCGVRGNGNIDVLKCAVCGLVRLSDAMQDVDGYYRDSKMWSYDTREYAGEVIASRAENATDTERRCRLTRNAITNKIVLDFGCGSGGYLQTIKPYARNIYGIELETKMNRFLNDEGIICYSSLDEAEKKLDRKVDVITMWHVLEHLENPIEMLQRISALMTEQGRLFIEVPNADDVLLSLFGCEAFADFTYWECHLYLYTMETLRKLIQKAGLRTAFMTQVQRYPLANHLYWLTKGKSGGHEKWSMLCDAKMDELYGEKLATLGLADTIVAEVSV